MLSKKFNSNIVGNEYSRTMEFSVQYTAPMTATVNVIVQPHVKLDDVDNDTHRSTGAAKSFSFNINPTDFMPTSTEAGTVERVIELRDVATGELLGATMTMGQLFVGVSSLIREQELLVSGT